MVSARAGRKRKNLDNLLSVSEIRIIVSKGAILFLDASIRWLAACPQSPSILLSDCAYVII
jgi:hypothetical protein